MNRRAFLKSCAFAALSHSARSAPQPARGQWVNDIHSQLNRTRIVGIETPRTLEELQRAIRQNMQQPICIAGGRHAMGAQQFGTDALMLDTRSLSRVLSFDPLHGRVTVEAGIQWPALIEQLVAFQESRERQWGIAQKQTGADRLCLGGALAANIHGRGLAMSPLIGDVESFTLVDAAGELRECSRTENPDLFRLAIGGYGLFGAIYSITLRLAQRCKLERVVEVLDIEELMPAFNRCIRDGFLYGDFQYATAADSTDFMRKGVFSCYRPVPNETPITEQARRLSESDWTALLELAHTDKALGFRRYADFYLSTSGQIYWSDTHQLSAYVDDYHLALDCRVGPHARGTEMITEIYVPRTELAEFMAEARADFRRHHVDVIYGTIRLIQRDEESFLPWARQSYACVIFNLHTEHSPNGIAQSSAACRRLIDMAARPSGSFYLTYHKWATRRQLEECHPRLPEFLRLKRQHDPAERFQSDWYRHQRALWS